MSGLVLVAVATGEFSEIRSLSMSNDTLNEVGETLADRVEDEEPDFGTTSIRPWDPALIRINTKSYSLRQVVDEIADGTIDLAPDFQREGVWQESQLIESILLGIPLPSFYFSADADGSMQVVDGVQRLTTISRFATGKFKLDGVEYIDPLRGKTFEQIDSAWRRRFHSTQILVHVIEPQTPAEVKFDIFRRINTGGTPLTAQQIRHCISRARSRDLLERMSTSAVFLQATRCKLLDDKHMTAREFALRFIAFSFNFDPEAYRRFDTLDDFLIDVTRRLDGPSSISDAQIEQIEATFSDAMRRAREVFGDKAFRRWKTVGAAGPLNRALFDSWAVALSEVTDAGLVERADRIVSKAREAMTNDLQYIQSFSVATGAASRVEYRLKKARELSRESEA